MGPWVAGEGGSSTSIQWPLLEMLECFSCGNDRNFKLWLVAVINQHPNRNFCLRAAYDILERSPEDSDWQGVGHPGRDPGDAW